MTEGPTRRASPAFILARFKRPLYTPRAAAAYDAEGCLRAVWNDETRSFEIVLEFWQDNRAYLEDLRKILFDGIPSEPIRQRPIQEALRPGLYIHLHSELPYFCLQFKEESVREACALFRPFMQIGYAWLRTSCIVVILPRPPTFLHCSWCRAAEADAALAYLAAKDAQNTGAAERALLELMNLNVGGQLQPLHAHQLPSQQEFDAWTDQQARIYVAAYSEHAGIVHLKQTLLANQLFDVQVLHCHAASCIHGLLAAHHADGSGWKNAGFIIARRG